MKHSNRYFQSSQGTLLDELLDLERREPGSAPVGERWGSPEEDREPTDHEAENLDDELFSPEDWLPEGAAETNAEEAESDGDSQHVSTIANSSIKRWPERARKRASPFGLVVHSTGSGAPTKAAAEGLPVTDWAVRHYKRKGGTHYVIGWGGVDAGELVQVASDRAIAWGVSMRKQRASVRAGRFERDLSPTTVHHWRQRWPDHSDPMALLPPGARSVNSHYVHVECPPCVYYSNKIRYVPATPMRKGLRFTAAQHDAVAALAVDLARRHGWDKDAQWWRTTRLLGHEDVSPMTRSTSAGGWDPGALRDQPRFDWAYVYAEVERLSASRQSSAPAPWRRMVGVLGNLARGFFSSIQSGHEAKAVSDAIRGGLRDQNTLTNLVFFARHPEMGGRKIRRQERVLAQEWLNIRSSVVRPLLATPSGEDFVTRQVDVHSTDMNGVAPRADDDDLEMLFTGW